MCLFGILAGWQPLQWIQQILRESWSRDYFNNLQQRSKWVFIQPNLHPDTVIRGQGQQPPILEQKNSSGAGDIYADVMICCELQLQEVTDAPFTSY
jgi:hypothetical protein